VFHTDVAKVEWDVAYVAMVVDVCCKHLSPIFNLFFGHMLQVYFSLCCIGFTHMLQVFYLHIAYVSNVFKCFFGSVSNAYLKYLICLQTYVASVAPRCFKSKSGVAHRIHVGSGKGR
jgi:hypothetical protein